MSLPFLKITDRGGFIGNIWWVNPDDEIVDVSPFPWSTLLARRAGSFGIGFPAEVRYNYLSESELEGILR
jgi:hypothetical protein